MACEYCAKMIQKGDIGISVERYHWCEIDMGIPTHWLMFEPMAGGQTPSSFVSRHDSNSIKFIQTWSNFASAADVMLAMRYSKSHAAPLSWTIGIATLLSGMPLIRRGPWVVGTPAQAFHNSGSNKITRSPSSLPVCWCMTEAAISSLYWGAMTPMACKFNDKRKWYSPLSTGQPPLQLSNNHSDQHPTLPTRTRRDFSWVAINWVHCSWLDL